MSSTVLPELVELKVDLLFEGLRYSDALGRAAEHSFPNFVPYRFAPGEGAGSGMRQARIPYMLVTDGGTHCRVKGSGSSRYWVSGKAESGYQLHRDGDEVVLPVRFEPAVAWMSGTTLDGFPRAQAGISLHGDMAVINVAPGCEYFLAPKQNGRSMRCTFCSYGAPDERSKQLGQVMGQTALPELLYARMQELLAAALAESDIRHIYLVGGSLTDPREEGLRFAELARRVQQVNQRRVPVTCGSGALPDESLRVLSDEQLVDAICFNLEIWSQPLFEAICPGKHRFMGYDAWIASLERAVEIWGPGHVYSAMVAGVELGPDFGLSTDEALEIALRGAADLVDRGILPIYSLYWPPAGRDLPEHLAELRGFFERLQLGYREIRREAKLEIWDGFLCRRCAYMQLECDLDRALPGEPVL